jgi:spermidine synthase
MSTIGRKVCFEKSQFIVYQPYLGLHLAYHAKRFCFSGQSKYQKIDIIDNDAYGRMLFLDDNVQHTAYDSMVFNEALCGRAKRAGVNDVLVLGGGSGQSALALLQSPLIKQITIVEIDPLVIDCCRKYIKGVNRAFKDPRVRIVTGDAAQFLHSVTDKFDASIIDFTERPFGKTNQTALKQLYSDIKEKCNGRCSQYVGSSVDLAYNRRLRSVTERLCKQIFTNVRYEQVFIPSFGAPHRFMHAGYTNDTL